MLQRTCFILFVQNTSQVRCDPDVFLAISVRLFLLCILFLTAHCMLCWQMQWMNGALWSDMSEDCTACGLIYYRYQTLYCQKHLMWI